MNDIFDFALLDEGWAFDVDFCPIDSGRGFFNVKTFCDVFTQMMIKLGYNGIFPMTEKSIL